MNSTKLIKWRSYAVFCNRNSWHCQWCPICHITTLDCSEMASGRQYCYTVGTHQAEAAAPQPAVVHWCTQTPPSCIHLTTLLALHWHSTEYSCTDTAQSTAALTQHRVQLHWHSSQSTGALTQLTEYRCTDTAHRVQVHWHSTEYRCTDTAHRVQVHWHSSQSTGALTQLTEYRCTDTAHRVQVHWHSTQSPLPNDTAVSKV
jgi:hypothetical protein